MDTPHISAGAGGVIAKLRYCSEDYVSVAVYLLLYLCPNYPPANELDWPAAGCVVKATARSSWNAQPQTWYTRYVPPSGTPGAHGTGYWVACAIINDGVEYMIPSAPQWLSA